MSAVKRVLIIFLLLSNSRFAESAACSEIYKDRAGLVKILGYLMTTKFIVTLNLKTKFVPVQIVGFQMDKGNFATSQVSFMERRERNNRSYFLAPKNISLENIRSIIWDLSQVVDPILANSRPFLDLEKIDHLIIFGNGGGVVRKVLPAADFLKTKIYIDLLGAPQTDSEKKFTAIGDLPSPQIIFLIEDFI